MKGQAYQMDRNSSEACELLRIESVCLDLRLMPQVGERDFGSMDTFLQPSDQLATTEYRNASACVRRIIGSARGGSPSSLLEPRHDRQRPSGNIQAQNKRYESTFMPILRKTTSLLEEAVKILGLSCLDQHKATKGTINSASF